LVELLKANIGGRLLAASGFAELLEERKYLKNFGFESFVDFDLRLI